MDVATFLEEYIADLNSLPDDLAFVLEEIKSQDVKLLEVQKRIQILEEALQKDVTAHGASHQNPREQTSYAKIEDDYQLSTEIQRQKVSLAKFGLFLVANYVEELDENVKQFENAGVVPPLALQEENGSKPKIEEPEPKRRASGAVNKSSVQSSIRRGSRSTSDNKSAATPTNASAAPMKAAPVSSSTAAAVPTAQPSTQIAKPTTSAPASSIASQNSEKDTSQRANVEINGARLSLKRTHSSVRQPPSGVEDHESFCYCKKGSLGNMIACDSDNCDIEWFHWECVGLTQDPKGSWFCPRCRDKIKRAK